MIELLLIGVVAVVLFVAATFLPGPFTGIGAAAPTTGGPAPISRWPGLSAIPPSRGAFWIGDGRTKIVSPGPEAC